MAAASNCKRADQLEPELVGGVVDKSTLVDKLPVVEALYCTRSPCHAPFSNHVRYAVSVPVDRSVLLTAKGAEVAVGSVAGSIT